jgi:hypothetical protein
VTPKLSTTDPLKGLASLSTINAAIAPRRGAFADLPAFAYLWRLACPACSEIEAGGLPQGSRSRIVPPHRAYS